MAHLMFSIKFILFLLYRSKVLVDLLGIDSLTSTFGLLVLFRGIASILGPPLGGLVYESSSKGKFSNTMIVSWLFSENFAQFKNHPFRNNTLSNSRL